MPYPSDFNKRISYPLLRNTVIILKSAPELIFIYFM